MAGVHDAPLVAVTDAPGSYPEHEKLRAIKDKSQAIYDFLAWCEEEKGYGLAVDSESGYQGEKYWVPESKRDLLAEFFGIDQQKLEGEKRAMLDEMRRMNDEAQP
jgi:hypothetical protein